MSRPDDLFTRREALRGALVGGAMLGAGGVLAACGGGASPTTTTEGEARLRHGGTLRVGATGGGAADTIDAHRPTGDPDAMRVVQLYEPLALRTPDFSRLEMVLAESIEPAGKAADAWTVRLRRGVVFHDGKPLGADDVIFSLRRILDPKDPKVGASLIGDVDLAGIKKLDRRTLRIPLKRPNAGFPDAIGVYANGIVPVGYDPRRPVGTGPFKYRSFTPGRQSVFARNPDYWRTGEPFVDELIISDFTEDTPKVNALLAGQAQVIDSVPAAQLAQIKANPNLRVVTSPTGLWQPFTMRADQAPFDDVRVRQAFRLIVDRPQMIEQALAGQGRVANDLFAPYDPCYDSTLPQRRQDLEQARSLLKAAGRSDMSVELVTAPVFQGIVEAAQVFAQQAKGAGVNVSVRNVDSGTYFGDNYLKWTFAQDFWGTRTFLVQVTQGSLPGAPFNETHWTDARFVKRIDQARGELDEAKRCQILHEAQRILYDSGAYIVWSFSNQIDAHSASVSGISPAKSGLPLANYTLRRVGYVA
jgi:peptide/nickel transport system substrate-binding protein